MTGTSPVFAENLSIYMERFGSVDVNHAAERLGGNVENGEVLVPFFGAPYRVGSKGVFSPDGERAAYTEAIVFYRLVLSAPLTDPAPSGWKAFRDFPDAAPLRQYYDISIEGAVASHFEGKPQELRLATERLGGETPDGDFSYDVTAEFRIFPTIPMLLLFNDRDEDFPASASILFRGSVEKYLDMESVAILAGLLMRRLQNLPPQERPIDAT